MTKLLSNLETEYREIEAIIEETTDLIELEQWYEELNNINDRILELRLADINEQTFMEVSEAVMEFATDVIEEENEDVIDIKVEKVVANNKLYDWNAIVSQLKPKYASFLDYLNSIVSRPTRLPCYAL